MHHSMKSSLASVGRPFLGIHLRLGDDMAKVCSRIEQNPDLFAFQQCLSLGIDPNLENCLPTNRVILTSVERTIVEFPFIKAIFVASDSRLDKIAFIKDFVSQRFPSLSKGLASFLKPKFSPCW